MNSMPKELLIEFIELYQRNPCLWETNSPDYYNHNSKDAAYQNLVDLIKPVFPNADKDFVRAKIQSIRGSHRKVCSKIKNWRSSRGKVYKPSLWYFEKLQFLRDNEEEVKSEQELIGTEENQELSEVEGRTSSTENEVVFSVIQNTVKDTENSNAFPNKRKKRKLDEKNYCEENVSSKPQDPFDELGNVYASNLRTIHNLEDKNQLNFCKNLVDQVLTLALMGELTEFSLICEQVTSNDELDANFDPANPPCNASSSFTLLDNIVANSIYSGDENSKSDLPPGESHDKNLNSENPVRDSVDSDLIKQFNETHAADNTNYSGLSFRNCFSPSKSHVDLHSAYPSLNSGNSPIGIYDLDSNMDQSCVENFSLTVSKVDDCLDPSWDSGNSSTTQLFPEICDGPVDDYENIFSRVIP